MGYLNTAVFISGRGSNLEALIKSCDTLSSKTKISLVISNNPKAPGLFKAEQKNIPTKIIDHHLFPDRFSFESSLLETLQNYKINFICLAGFMKILSKQFIEKWDKKIINIHPSLLPAFPGLNTHQRVLESGVKFTGCTVHFVDANIDTGPIIIQAITPVLSKDTSETLATRVLELEHKIYPIALQWLAKNKLTVINNKVLVNEKLLEDQSFLIYPTAS
ncbi:MAG: phosphoribosylglycinamide formyltransferase [Alphaproteobacteria bacterium]|nr:phosphoribosylglycinamide formyltransferase [Alphaproteobacteria bacterium]